LVTSEHGGGKEEDDTCEPLDVVVDPRLVVVGEDVVLAAEPQAASNEPTSSSRNILRIGFSPLSLYSQI